MKIKTYLKQNLMQVNDKHSDGVSTLKSTLKTDSNLQKFAHPNSTKFVFLEQ